MLVMTRKVGESIRIHTIEGVIEVFICSHKGHQIKVGGDAPTEVIVLRS